MLNQEIYCIPETKNPKKEFSHTESQTTQIPFSKSTSHKAIHYERQTQLRFKHLFDLASFYEQLPLWCSRANLYGPGQFLLRFEFTLPARRKYKRNSFVYDLISAKEYEAAQTGLMYARSLFDVLSDEHYRYRGYKFGRGLQIGPSWIEKGKMKTCATLSIMMSGDHAEITAVDVLTFATHAIFSNEDLNHMQAVTAKVYFNGELLGSMDIEVENTSCEFLEFAPQYYSYREIQEILYSQAENRNVLYAFKTEKGIRQGMMIKTDTLWKLVEIKKIEDIYKTVKDYSVVEFIPAVNRIDEEYPSIITIETDPGDMLQHVLGKRKTWVFNTYVTEKILAILDTYRINYNLKFSGNKGWHILIPIELKEPFDTYQKVVEAIVNKELGNLPHDEKILAMMANLMQLEDVKSYKDPFFLARRFVDLVGAHIMFYELKDIHTILTLNDLRRLCLRVAPAYREDFLRKGGDLYETGRGPVRVELPQVLSINPYSRFRRQFKLLIDHSSNKKEGKLRSPFSLHSRTGLVSIPAVVYRDDGKTRIDERFWDYDFVCALANPRRMCNQIEGLIQDEYPLMDSVRKWESNDVRGFEEFFHDHRGLLIYLLQNGGEALELLDCRTALWVNANLWEKTVTS